jgi:3-oxoacyl-[acyl-carrier protein] reductase
MELADKTVLVTGGSDGLGFAIAKKLLQRKAKVVICGRSLQRLEQAKSRLNSANLSTIQCDVSDYQAVTNMVAKLGPIDILINNAGIWVEGDLETHTPEHISQTIDINLKGAIYVTRAVLPDMKQRNEGFIFNISSTSGTKGKPGQSVYVASKFGVRGFTESLKIDLYHTNIKVAGFYPGGMKTKLFEKTGSNKDVSQYMDPNKVAAIVIFILERDDTMIMDHVVLNKRIKSRLK